MPEIIETTVYRLDASDTAKDRPVPVSRRRVRLRLV